jgi:hypothetical protein
MNYEDLLNNHTSKLIDQFLGYTLTQDNIEIHFDFLDDDQWSVISMHQYEEDLEISIRLHLKGVYDIYLGYYDDEDEFHELIRPLTQEESDQLPKGLKKLMKKVVDDEAGLRVKGDFLK